MMRRVQLMEPERRGLQTRLADAAAGLRDGLLRDNKVLPPVLAALALVIFAWVLAGVIIGDPEEDRVARQAAQPSVPQAPGDGSAPSDSPAPGVENRDSESLDVYESKDPFRELIPTADAAAGGDTTGGTADSATPSAPGASDGNGSGSTDGTGDDAGSTDGTGDDAGSGNGGSGGSGTGSGNGGSGGSGTGSGDGSGGSGSGQYGGGGQDDFLDQTSPGDPGFDDGSGSGGENGGEGSGDGGSSGAGSGGGAGQYGDGNGDLFDSGGNLRR